MAGALVGIRRLVLHLLRMLVVVLLQTLAAEAVVFCLLLSAQQLLASQFSQLKLRVNLAEETTVEGHLVLVVVLAAAMFHRRVVAPIRAVLVAVRAVA